MLSFSVFQRNKNNSTLHDSFKMALPSSSHPYSMTKSGLDGCYPTSERHTAWVTITRFFSIRSPSGFLSPIHAMGILEQCFFRWRHHVWQAEIVSFWDRGFSTRHQGCNWGMQIDWWFQPRAVFGHTFKLHHLAYATKIKSIQLHDSIVMASPWDNIIYITWHTISRERIMVKRVE